LENLRDDRGLTLIEVITVSLILLLVIGAVYSILLNGMVSLKIGEGQMDVQQNVRVAMNRITREIRGAKKVLNMNEQIGDTYYPAGENNLYLEDAKGTKIWFYLREVNNRVSIYRAAWNVGKSDWGRDELAYGIMEMKFDYDQKDPITNARLVTVRITGRQGDRVYTLESKAKLRIPAQ